MRIGRIAGVPVRLAPSWWLGAAVLVGADVPVVLGVVDDPGVPAAGVAAALLVATLGVSVLLHELAHCLVARAFGLRVWRIRLDLLGGRSTMHTATAAPGVRAVVAAAGPAASLVLAGVLSPLLLVVPERTVGWLVLVQWVTLNLGVGVVNAVPLPSLDGGQVLRALRDARRPTSI